MCHTENCYVVFMDYNNASYEVRLDSGLGAKW